MKPCSRNRKTLAWLALGELDARTTAALRAHIETCDGCRHYLAEISSVKETLTTTEPTPDLEASESFHRRVVTRLRAEQSGSLWDRLAERLGAGRLSWRAALSLLGATALVIALLSVLWRQPAVPRPAPNRVQAVLPPGPKNDLSPTITNYQRVANRSLDELDDLLTRQATRRLSPTPIYTASMFAAANAAD
jgi:anti-sigma factor RsiW